MAKPGFKKMGGASRSDPSPLRRWAISILMRRFANTELRDKRRARLERKRQRSGAPHQVEYFHQAEDPYSHLAAQVLPRFASAYDVQLVPHLVGMPPGNNLAQPELLLPYSQHDCELVAPHFGLEFPTGATPPDATKVAIANRILAQASPGTFTNGAVAVGRALWAEGESELSALADRVGLASEEVADRRLEAGNRRRTTLGHYSGATFYYGGEWYWGIDRLHHLEQRLMALGLRTDGEREVLVPRPPVENGPLQDDGSLTLEVYLSVRSPYSSIIFDKVVELAEDTGVELITRPVLPMVMRGVPVTFAKGKYIFFDTSREAESLGVQWGNVYDPIGKPVRMALALFPWADSQNKGVVLISNFLRMAWREGINTNTAKGLRKVVEASGLDWSEAHKRMHDTNWEALAEENRRTMYADGLWGVPSYRLLDSSGRCLLSTWGQDRLWLVSKTIQRHLQQRQAFV